MAASLHWIKNAYNTHKKLRDVIGPTIVTEAKRNFSPLST